MKPYVFHTLDEVRQTTLIPAARLDEIAADIESRISTVHDKHGNVITTSRIARFKDGSAFVYPRMVHESDWQYMRRELFSDALTDVERKLINDHCASVQDAARERERFEKATKLTEWDGWVTDGDRYWADVESYLQERGDEIEQGGEWEMPPYLWVAEPQRVITDMSVADVTENQVCDRGWEDMDPIDDLEGVPELQAALDAFVKANESVLSYTPDYSRAVLLEAYLAKP